MNKELDLVPLRSAWNQDSKTKIGKFSLPMTK